ncbi:MAG: GNAT family N-acetyltransferase [Dyella sp.]|uniref:GNAT family N-acetyltransferase n=1 Tax=Dyella sp. TaxID=1869338 RepID=UPI003F7D0D3D
MAFVVRPGDLSDEAVQALLREHLAGVALHSPPESIHALDLDGLRAPGMSFWTLWDGGALLACGALKELDGAHGEVKSMRTAAVHLRKGAARVMLQHIVAEARRRGYRRLSLETGTAAAFEPAHRLYAAAGFVPCGPFNGYVDDPYSCFMTLAL